MISTHANENCPTQIQSKLAHLSRLVGDTPMVGINFHYRGRERVIYAKCEQWNLTGSIKDRMAFQILKMAYLDGAIQPSDTIVEATSGNSGIAFAAIGRALGHEVKIMMPDWMSIERTRTIESYGATVVPISKEDGGFLGSFACVKTLLHCVTCFCPGSSQIIRTYKPTYKAQGRRYGPNSAR